MDFVRSLAEFLPHRYEWLILAVVFAITAVYYAVPKTAPPKLPALPGPPSGGGKALLHRLRDDAFLALVRDYGRTFAYDGVVATADPAIMKAVLLSRAHSLGRSIMYRLIARLMPWSDGLLFAAHDEWRKRHNLFTSLLSSAHVKQFTCAMSTSALIVAALHAQAQALGDRGTPSSGWAAESVEADGAALVRAATCLGVASGCSCLVLPLGAPRSTQAPCAHSTAGDMAGGDMLTSLRWVSARGLLQWACALDADLHGTHPQLARRGYACACEPVKRLAKCMDAHVRICVELMPECEISGGSMWWLQWLRMYRTVWRVGYALRAVVKDIIELEGVLWCRPKGSGPPSVGGTRHPYTNASRAHAHGACLAGCAEDGSSTYGPMDLADRAVSPCPILLASSQGRAPPSLPLQAPSPADTFLSRMASSLWSIDDITSELNHLHGAHKAAAFVAHAAMVELSANDSVRTKLHEEFTRVLGSPPPMDGTLSAAPAHEASLSRLRALLSHIQATAAGTDGGVHGSNGSETSPAGGCAFGCGWRVPSKSDLDETGVEGTRLPVLRAVFKETLRHHVVSMGTMRKLGEPLAIRLHEHSPPPGAATGHGVVREVVLPTGTEVILLLHALHHDEKHWGADAQQWLPQRWMDSSDAHERAASSAFLPFLEGLRRCAGMYSAELQFACYLHAWLHVADLRAKLPPKPQGSLDALPGLQGVGCGTLAGLDKAVSRDGALSWIHNRGAGEEGKEGLRLGLVKRPDMFTGLDGHVAFVARL